MNAYCETSATDVPSFESLFSIIRPPAPRSTSTSSSTKAASLNEAAISGPSFLEIRHLQLDELTHHGGPSLSWAINFLKQHSPVLRAESGYHLLQPSLRAHSFPTVIRSEAHATTYFRQNILDMAVMAATALHADLFQLDQAAPERFCFFPGGFWAAEDTSSFGTSGRADLSVMRRKDVLEGDTRHPAAICEAKTTVACRSRGTSISGENSTSLEILPELAKWLRQNNGVIPMRRTTPANISEQITHPEPWQGKLQKMLLQVCVLPQLLHSSANY